MMNDKHAVEEKVWVCAVCGTIESKKCRHAGNSREYHLITLQDYLEVKAQGYSYSPTKSQRRAHGGEERERAY